MWYSCSLKWNCIKLLTFVTVWVVFSLRRLIQSRNLFYITFLLVAVSAVMKLRRRFTANCKWQASVVGSVRQIVWCSKPHWTLLLSLFITSFPPWATSKSQSHSTFYFFSLSFSLFDPNHVSRHLFSVISVHKFSVFYCKTWAQTQCFSSRNARAVEGFPSGL